jgi:hypothetical protein
MPNNTDWIKSAIVKAQHQTIQVPDAVWTHLDALLTEKLSQRPLPAGELASIATQAIERRTCAPATTEEPN